MIEGSGYPEERCEDELVPERKIGVGNEGGTEWHKEHFGQREQCEQRGGWDEWGDWDWHTLLCILGAQVRLEGSHGTSLWKSFLC